MNSSSLELHEDKLMESSSADDSSIISKSDLVDTGRRATSTPIDKWSTSCPSISMLGNGDSSDVGVDHSDEYGSQSLGIKPEMYGVAAPKYGTLVPNRIFVGGISSSTTEEELADLFSPYGQVRATKIIVDRAGVSKGYGFVTFETEEEAKRLYIAINEKEIDPIIHRERRLNIAPAVKKQPSIVSDGIPVSRAHELPYASALDGTSTTGFGVPYFSSGHGQSSGQYYQQQPYDPYFSQSNYPGHQPGLQHMYSSAPTGQVCYIPTPYPGYQQLPPGTAYISLPASSSGPAGSSQHMYTSNGGNAVPTAYVVDPSGQNGPWTALTPGAPPVPLQMPVSSWTNVPMYRELDGCSLGSMGNLIPQGGQQQLQHDPDMCNCIHQMNALQINSY